MVLSMTHYQDLIDKVRACGGPDRELDAMVLCTLLAPEGSKVEQSTFNGNWCIHEPRLYGKSPFSLWERCPQEFRTSSVTTSIDAALALVERCLPGWNWHLNRLGQPRAIINDGPRAQFECWRNTALPLAIIEVLLLALQSNEATNVEDK